MKKLLLVGLAVLFAGGLFAQELDYRQIIEKTRETWEAKKEIDRGYIKKGVPYTAEQKAMLESSYDVLLNDLIGLVSEQEVRQVDNSIVIDLLRQAALKACQSKWYKSAKQDKAEVLAELNTAIILLGGEPVEYPPWEQ